MVQLMLLPPIISRFSKVQNGSAFLVPAYTGCTGKETAKRVQYQRSVQSVPQRLYFTRNVDLDFLGQPVAVTSLPTLVLIAQAVFLLECRHINTHKVAHTTDQTLCDNKFC